LPHSGDDSINLAEREFSKGDRCCEVWLVCVNGKRDMLRIQITFCCFCPQSVEVSPEQEERLRPVLALFFMWDIFLHDKQLDLTLC